jgi:hypothetical protein
LADPKHLSAPPRAFGEDQSIGFAIGGVDLLIARQGVARMEARDGSFGFDFVGICEEVDAPHALTQRLDDGRKTRTTFALEGEGTRVTTIFDLEDLLQTTMDSFPDG